MDPFEVRIQFLALLRRLTASQQSIQKIVKYALNYYSRCGEDIWDCLVEECQKGTVNTRINILYLLDSLCETSLLSKANFQQSNGVGSTNAPGSSESTGGSLYVDYVARDIGKIVEYVVPEGREGLPNLMSTVQILDNWRSKRIIDPQKVDEIMDMLNRRKTTHPEPQLQPHQTQSQHPQQNQPQSQHQQHPQQHTHRPLSSTFSRNEIFKRIEEDRERHKRLRERRWVQPISYNPNPHLLPQLASFMPFPEDHKLPVFTSPLSQPQNTSQDASAVLATNNPNPNPTSNLNLTIDIEFDNEWETTSDWNEDDEEAVAEENALCFPDLGGSSSGNTGIGVGVGVGMGEREKDAMDVP